LVILLNVSVPAVPHEKRAMHAFAVLRWADMGSIDAYMTAKKRASRRKPKQSSRQERAGEDFAAADSVPLGESNEKELSYR